MNDLFDSFQHLLQEVEPDYADFCRQLRLLQQSLTGRALVCSNMLLRLCFALADLEDKHACEADILILLRQVIRAFSRRVYIKRTLWHRLREYSEKFGLYLSEDATTDMIGLIAMPWQPDWLSKTDTIDELEQRRSDTPVLGDGIIYALSHGRFTTYQSEAQKVAVQECLFASPGATILITLPTGAGKSLCTQLPAWQASHGGKIKGGTTLVIVPTVSLALDQEERSQRSFSEAVGPEFTPCSLTGSTQDHERAAIYQGLTQGTLPILYTSPEALMNPSLYHVCLEAARRGMLTRLVIDEAHLIETWGAGFRTEFQFLATYRQQLLEASQGQLRTILLSATINMDCERLLKRLFGGRQGQFYSIRADRLRPEIAYWFASCRDEAERRERVIEALRYLPRPVIIYVASPEDARTWHHVLREHGFERSEVFSGETKSDDRLRLLRNWNENQYDIMVATTAFGVGVDKSDIRTIVHACLPENIDRFYQEVGRGGRDGFSSISLMCLSPGDIHRAQQMNRTARITIPKAISRWEGMTRAYRPHPTRSDIVFLDANAPPSEKQEMYQGPSNKEWNEHTLLLMQRANLIKITDLSDKDLLTEQEEIEDATVSEEQDRPAWLQIELLSPHITSYPRNQEFTQRLERVRSKEVGTIKQKLTEMQKLVSSYAHNQARRCIANCFTEVYPYSIPSCGGCSVCRQNQQPPCVRDLELEREGKYILEPGYRPQIALTTFMGQRTRVNIILDEPCSILALKETQSALVQLVKMRMQQVILPTELTEDQTWLDRLIAKLSMSNEIKTPHVLLNEQWLYNAEELPLYAVPTVLCYPLENERADHVHRLFSRFKANQPALPIIAFARRSLFLASENGLFVEKVNGLSYALERLQEQTRKTDDLVF